MGKLLSQDGKIANMVNGKAKAIRVGIAKYEQDIETFALLKMLSQSRQAYVDGNFKTARRVFTDIRKKIKKYER